ncbi:MAG TPA: A24 family peptidase [Candidatus Baltobacteraceae bacterium]|nr:A24 family peptidase [Candidatus Baltobacteraceae bacterium]
MLVTIATMLVGAAFFAGAVYLGIALGNAFAERVPALPDGPAPHKVPNAILLAAGAVIGAIVSTHAAMPSQSLLIAIVCVALAAIWVTDSRRGIVPDVFTLGPALIVAATMVWDGQTIPLLFSLVPAACFALAAMLSKGRGMGWGDVKLVALGGVVLGFQFSMLAFIVACLAAVAVNYSRGKRRGIIAFAPYLAASIALALPIGMWR